MDVVNKQTHIKGLIGELEFSLYLVQKGWNVFMPLDPNSRIDMIIEKEGKFQRIQVKYCTPHKGCLKVDLEHRIRKTKHFSKEEIDSIGVFDSQNRKFYLVPFTKILPRQGIWLRVAESNNNKGFKINWAKDFEI